MEAPTLQTINVSYSTKNNCSSISTDPMPIQVAPGRIVEIVLAPTADFYFQSVLETKQPKDGAAQVAFVNIGPSHLMVVSTEGSQLLISPNSRSEGLKFHIGRNNYSVYETSDSMNSTALNSSKLLYIGSLDVKIGGRYSVFLTIRESENALTALRFEDKYQVEDVNHFSVNVAWMIPQYVILTVAEVFLSITGLEFAYTQAPPSMKTVVTSFWQLTVSLGNVIVVIITQMKTLERQAHEFLLFASLIGMAAVVFILIGRRYHPVDSNSFANDHLDDDMPEEGEDEKVQRA